MTPPARGRADGGSPLRRLSLGMAALAGATLLVAYVGICLETGSAWPWTAVVHETGARTLLGTILYYEHAVRELPVDLVLGVAIGGSALHALPPAGEPSGSGDGRRLRLIASAAIAGILVAVMLVGTVATEGGRTLLDNLLQKHTRPGEPLVLGSHWRYHLLSRLSLMLLSLGIAVPARLARSDRGGHDHRARPLAVTGVALGGFALATLAFTRDPASLLLSLTDARYLGHQAREVVTHALVTLPLGWAACLGFRRDVAGRGGGGKASRPGCGSGSPRRGRGPERPTVALVGALAGAAIAGYVGIGALVLDASSLGQTGDLGMLIFPHFFEHGFSYVLVPTVAALAFELGSPSRRA